MGERPIETDGVGLAAARRPENGCQGIGPPSCAKCCLRWAADTGLHIKARGGRGGRRSDPPRPRPPLQSGVRHRDVVDRSPSPSAHRGLRAHAEAVAAALSSRRRRRRRQDDHDRPLPARDHGATASSSRSGRPAGGTRRQLGARNAHAVPPSVQHCPQFRCQGRQSVHRAGKRPGDSEHRHVGRRTDVRAVTRGRGVGGGASLRSRGLRRSAQALRRPGPRLPRAQDGSLPSRRSLGRSAPLGTHAGNSAGPPRTSFC